MRRPGLQARKPKRRRGLTRQDRSAPKFPDLLRRDFTAPAPNVRWCGDITEIPIDEGKLYLASVLDLHSQRLLASPTSDHPDTELARDAIKMAATVRGGRAAIDGVIFHTDRGSLSDIRCQRTWARTLSPPSRTRARAVRSARSASRASKARTSDSWPSIEVRTSSSVRKPEIRWMK